jgi:hypothetical protein
MFAELTFLIVVAALALPDLIVRVFDIGWRRRSSSRPRVTSPRALPS